MDTEYSIRRAVPDDALVVAAQRRSMFLDMGETAYATADGIDEQFTSWVQDRIARAVYIGWLVCLADGTPVAGAGLDLRDGAPLPGDFSTVRGYIMNVYVQPAHRQRGLARCLMQTLLEYCRQNGVRGLSLHASSAGRHLYATLGFQESNEMRLMLPWEGGE